MDFALDQYFTPVHVATRLATVVRNFTPKAVIDSNCGSGELLTAYQTLDPKSEIYGIDLDRKVINRLAIQKPAWSLIQGDALNSSTWRNLKRENFCAAVLNPPFSIAGTKYVNVKLQGQVLRASPALAHIITAIENGQPEVIAAILPESSASSEIDGAARIAIGNFYDVEIMERLSASTFPGASANAFIARMVRNVNKNKIQFKSLATHCALNIVRGGLPVFQCSVNNRGLPFIHSIDLKNLGLMPMRNFKKVLPIGRGVIQGHHVLFPRVGTPKKEFLRDFYFENPVQLSDCVMGIHCENKEQAILVASTLRLHFDEFFALYKGTGAKYVSLDGIKAWLAGVF